MSQFLIADDHPLFREALKGALSAKFADWEVFESENFETTLQVLNEQEDLDILLLDLHMPGNGDLYGLIRIREDYPSLPIAVVSGSEDINVVSKVMAYGAMGFIPKSSSSDDIAMAINHILEGDVWLPSELKDKVSDVDGEDKGDGTEAKSEFSEAALSLTYTIAPGLTTNLAYADYEDGGTSGSSTAAYIKVSF